MIRAKRPDQAEIATLDRCLRRLLPVNIAPMLAASAIIPSERRNDIEIGRSFLRLVVAAITGGLIESVARRISARDTATVFRQDAKARAIAFCKGCVESFVPMPCWYDRC